MSGGDTIDTEDIGARGKLQRIKLVVGAIDTDGGDVAAGSAALPVQEQYIPGYEDDINNVSKVEQRFSYNNVTSNTTTTVKSSAGFLHCITINTHGATANTATIYDNTAGSGTKIGTLDTTSGDGKLYDVTFTVGLTIVTATGTAGDLTVSYR